MNFRNAYSEVNDIPSVNEEESRVKQAFRKECNINTIVQKARKGQVVSVNRKQPMFGDFTKAVDFQEMQNQIIDARAAFMQLPSKIRERFQNDPAKLLQFMENPENHEEAIRLGLLEIVTAPEVPETIKYLKQIAEQGAAAIDGNNGSDEPKKSKK